MVARARSSHEGRVRDGVLMYGDTTGAAWRWSSGEGLLPPAAKGALRPGPGIRGSRHKCPRNADWEHYFSCG